MSIWTSRRNRAALLGCALALTACGGAGPWTGEDTSPAPTQVAVTTDRLVVAGPQGYCVDPTATRDRGETAFVMMGNCAAISNSRRAVQPEVNAVLTASVSEASDGRSLRESIPGLDQFFRSEQGLTLLSRDQDPATVTVIDSFHQGDVYFLHARDTGQGTVDGVGDEYWRAYMDVGPRIATLSVLGLEGQSLSDEASLQVLRGFVTAVDTANAPGAPQTADPLPITTPDQGVPVTVTRPSDPTGTPLWNVGLFRRIFG